MKTKIWMGFLVLGIFIGIGQWAANGDTGFFESEGRPARVGVKPVQNTLYAEECGSCHFAYQPGLLPAASWKLIMLDLADHFGDNAELEPETQMAVRDYLVKNAADHASQKRSVKIMRSLKGKQVPLRISTLPYIVRKHHEIPQRLIKGNTDVGSLSNCTACHRKAEQGIYEEDTVNIPGVGRWDD